MNLLLYSTVFIFLLPIARSENVSPKKAPSQQISFSSLANAINNISHSMLDENASSKLEEGVNEKSESKSIQNSTANVEKIMDKRSDSKTIENSAAKLEEIPSEAKTKDKKEMYDRKPVKLNMKQGLTMNQIVNVYALSDVSNVLCRNHSKEFDIGLRAFEPWALKMFDSSTKLQSGVLLGNLMEFGSFSQCVEIYHKSQYGPIQGKHCVIKIYPDLELLRKILEYRNVTRRRFKKVYTFVKGAALIWSICMPDSCKAKDVMDHFSKIIYSFLEGLNITVSVNEEDCSTLSESLDLDSSETFILAGFGIFFFLLSAVTLVDIFAEENQSMEALVKTFSLVRNSKQIFVQVEERDDLDCLHGIRFLSTCYVVIGHRYLMMMFFPVINSLQIMDWVLYYRSTAITGGTLCVDTFFMISGMLVSIGFFKQVDKHGKMNWFLFYIYRYLRISVPLGIVVLIYSKFMHHFGSGPLWNDMLDIIQKPCQEYWWSVVLHIQNYVHPFPLCMTQVWYLTCDMQYYFLSPIILVPLWKWPVMGYIIFFIIYILSIVISFFLAWKNEYDGGVPITNQLFSTKYFQYHYIAPHTRAATYIIGLGLGYTLHRTKGEKYALSMPFVIVSWIVALATMLVSLVGCHTFHQETHDYNKLEASIFLSCSRSAWTFGVVWVVWACTQGYGGPVNTILSSHLFRVLGRISYSIYLLHMLLQYAMSGANKLPLYFADVSSIHTAFGDLITVIILGFMFTVCFESPLIRIMSLLSRKKVSDTNRKVAPGNKF